MGNVEFSRREALGTAIASALAGSSHAIAQPGRPKEYHAPTFDLASRPTRVFKVADHSHENTESWVFSLNAQTDLPEELFPLEMRVDLLKGTAVVRTSHYNAEAVQAYTYKSSAPPRMPDGSVPEKPFFWPFSIRFRATEPVTLAATGMVIKVRARDNQNRIFSAVRNIPLETYEQLTVLRFPFDGKGIVLQGGAADGGHRNRSGEFAIDAFGLDDSWSIIAPGDGKSNGDYRGFGRTIRAPADGVIVRARNDRPDQPVADVSDPKFYAREYPTGGDPGNFLAIDHGNGEFSWIAHFQAHSMTVSVGGHVRQGQPIGKLGHSGDTSGPHVHYQLQSGPDWEFSDALPFKFVNVDQSYLDRGTYFEAKPL